MRKQSFRNILLFTLAGLAVLSGLAVWFNGLDGGRKSGIPPKAGRDGGSRATRGHPYGNPAKGRLPWEVEQNFRLFQRKNQADRRMAAFRTTLPDPLPGEEYNVALAADRLAGRVISPGSVFSMNAVLGPYTKERGFRLGPVYVGTTVSRTIGGGVCKIATTLYNVAILADLPILERAPHSMLVPYVPPGQDATVTYGVQDLKFRNDEEYPLVLWADTIKNTLYMAIYGRSAPPAIKWHHRILDRSRSGIVYRINDKLQPGAEKVIIPGADGLTVRSWLTVAGQDGRSETKYLGTDRYTPMPRVVERGPASHKSDKPRQT